MGDDGFGPRVAARLAREELPAWVLVKDFGIRGLHLAFELNGGGYDTVILVDAVPRGERPGTVYLIAPNLKTPSRAQMDAHNTTPGAVFAAAEMLGGIRSRVLVVGCEPARTEEGVGLSGPVESAVPEAMQLVRTLIGEHAPLAAAAEA